MVNIVFLLCESLLTLNFTPGNLFILLEKKVLLDEMFSLKVNSK